ncbi:hypothetical protein OG21DRAFT_1585447, partial [Imleria badia]
ATRMLLHAENGFAMKDENSKPLEEALQNHDHVNYFKGTTTALKAAVLKDGVDMKAYFPWSFLDNFEWLDLWLLAQVACSLMQTMADLADILPGGDRTVDSTWLAPNISTSSGININQLIGLSGICERDILQYKVTSDWWVECDWWSLGAIIFECLVSYVLFCSENPSDTYKKIIEWPNYLYFPDKVQKLST